MRNAFLLAFCILLSIINNNALALEEFKDYWNKLGEDELDYILKSANQIINKRAKNVIFFLGDGMGVNTLNAARILKNQKNGKPGEEGYLSFERFPNLALMKTYNTDKQVPDSAGTATAFLTGVKTNLGLIGLDSHVIRGNCSTYKDEHKTYSVLKHSVDAGKAVGVITNTRLTHATPAAAFGHSADRDWEDDSDQKRNPQDYTHCPDLATQFLQEGLNFTVVFGGGRKKFLPSELTGSRKDGRNLINEWLKLQNKSGKNPQYVQSRQQLQNLDVTSDRILGLFALDHLQYEVDRLKQDESIRDPSMTELTLKAIEILKRDANGFFLLVEGGRIDHGHHDNEAKYAITDAVAFDEAIEATVQKLKEWNLLDDTLIIVTADHSHTFSLGGYSSRGRDIFEKTDTKLSISKDAKPFTSILYGNGPGGAINQGRADISRIDTTADNYRFQSAVYISSATHAGEDVPAFALGPMAHLLRHVHEQHYIAHVMMYASCVGPLYKGANKCPPK